MSPARILMVSSALLMAVLGLGATFLSHEFLTHIGIPPRPGSVLVVQTIGALYLGFALLNWGARGAIIGGVYARPVAMGNFMHFVVAAITFWKVAFALDIPFFFGFTAVYTILAAGFGWLLFNPPSNS